MKRTLVAGLCVLLVSSAVSAGMPYGAVVSANARWVAHMDVETLWASEFGEHILASMEQKGHGPAIDEFAENFGFDPRQDLRNITLWGESYEPNDGVLVVQADVDHDALLQQAAKARDYAEDSYGDYDLVTWRQEPQDPTDDGERWGTFWADDVVIITRDRDVLTSTLDTLNDHASTLAASPDMLGAQPEPGAFLFMAGVELEMPAQAGARAELLKNVSSGFVELGEVDGTMFLTVSLTAVDPEQGQDLRDMMEGILAFSRMSLRRMEQRGETPPHWAPLAESAEVGGELGTVTLSAAMPTADVIAMMEAAREGK